MMIQCSPVELYNYIRLIQWKNGTLYYEELKIHYIWANEERKGKWKWGKLKENKKKSSKE